MSFFESIITGSVPGLTAGVRTALPYITSLSLQGSALGGAALRAVSLGGIAPKLPLLSANEIIRRVRASGFTVQRSAALQVIKALKGQIAGHEYIQALANYLRPLKPLVPFAGQHQTYPYHVRVLITGRDNFTNEIRQQYVTVTSTRLISKNQAIEKAYGVALGGEGYNMVDLIGMEIVTYTQINPYLGSL